MLVTFRPLACGLAIAGLAAAQELPTAADVTEPGRSLDRALRVVLSGQKGSQTLYFLIDSTKSLVEAGFAKRLAAALAAKQAELRETSIGIARVGTSRGKKPAIELAPTTDHARVVGSVHAVLARPSSAFQNVYADIRKLAAVMDQAPGNHRICLVTLENGDAEDDLEETVNVLSKSRVQLSAITSESYLADSYWRTNRQANKPRGTELTGGDGPYTELPYGWVLQPVSVNEISPSGFAGYGITRLAAATKGKVFLYAPKAAGHKCTVYPTQACLFCSGDHINPAEVYWDARVRQLAPLAASRRDAFREVAHDPYFRAVMRAWRDAAKAGIVASSPPLKQAGSTVRRGRGDRPRNLGLMTTLGFGRNARRALAAKREVERILENLDADLERAEKNGRGRARQKAMAETTRLLLLITRVNLITYRGFCLELGLKLGGRIKFDYQPPERAITDNPRRAVGIGYSSMCLCHGAAPFLQVELPGENIDKELQRLDTEITRFLDRYAHTPFAIALDRSGIARFHLTFPGIPRSRPRKRPRSQTSDQPKTPTKTGRPSRSGSGSGSTSGPTTGK